MSHSSRLEAKSGDGTIEPWLGRRDIRVRIIRINGGAGLSIIEFSEILGADE